MENAMRHVVKAVCLVALLAACGGTGKPDGGDTAADAGRPVEMLAEGTVLEVPCIPQCEGRECGPNGCGAICGSCLPGIGCMPDGTCELCVPDCEGKECGPDGCGGVCGGCDDWDCSRIGCAPYDPCEGKQCGNWDGEWCGDCPCEDCEPEELDCDLETGKCLEEPGHCGCSCIFDRQDACPEKDEECRMDCVTSASINDQMGYNNVMQCWEDVDLLGCWDLCPEGRDSVDCPDEFHHCMDEKKALCEVEYFECYIPGDLACNEIFICFDGCPIDDTPCMQDCYQAGTKTAQKTASAMWDCYENAGVYDCWDLCPEDAGSTEDCPPEGQECFDETLPQCQDETDACFPPGFLSCSDLVVCIDTCPADPPGCPEACLDAGTEPGLAAYWDLQDCIESECGTEPAAACREQSVGGACSEAFSACAEGL